MQTEATLSTDRPLLDVQERDAETGRSPAAELSVSLSRWPNAAPFALFLSHDVDQIHDQELFRVLADVNHVRRRWVAAENGDVGLALRRIGRSLLRPKPATRDFETLVEMEAGYGFRSTFFLLHDRHWARHGARYSFGCRVLRDIAKLIVTAGSELGVHGGYYRFNNAALYRESIEALERHFGVRPCGIRNHLLRFSGVETWRAQAEAGFAYDATYGWADRLGPRDGLAYPFFPANLRPLPSDLCPPSSVLRAPSSDLSTIDLLELPLTVMDTTLFRYLRLGGDLALEAAWEAAKLVARAGGLVTLLWHNNFFNEPEYWDWQMVYERLLDRLADLKPWCATGAEIDRWWRGRAGVSLIVDQHSRSAILRTATTIHDLVLRSESQPTIQKVAVKAVPTTIAKVEHGWAVKVPELVAGEGFRIGW